MRPHPDTPPLTFSHPFHPDPLPLTFSHPILMRPHPDPPPLTFSHPLLDAFVHQAAGFSGKVQYWYFDINHWEKRLFPQTTPANISAIATGTSSSEPPQLNP